MLTAASHDYPATTHHCWLLRVTGWFVPDTGFLVHSVVGYGPATRMTSLDGDAAAALQPGDIISQIEFRRFDNESSWVTALNAATDPHKVHITVIDRNTHQAFDLLAAPIHEPDLARTGQLISGSAEPKL